METVHDNVGAELKSTYLDCMFNRSSPEDLTESDEVKLAHDRPTAVMTGGTSVFLKEMLYDTTVSRGAESWYRIINASVIRAKMSWDRSNCADSTRGVRFCKMKRRLDAGSHFPPRTMHTTASEVSGASESNTSIYLYEGAKFGSFRVNFDGGNFRDCSWCLEKKAPGLRCVLV